MMKTLLLFLVLLSVISCTEDSVQESKQVQVDQTKQVNLNEDLFSWLDTIPGSKMEYTSVFAVTPNDCNSCMELFTEVMRRQLNNKSPENRICIVFQNIRSIEREAVIKSAFQGIDTTNVPIIWNDKLFQQVHEFVPGIKGGSVLLVFDRTNKLLFSKAGKSVTGTEPELKNIFR
jgi:hypothetical protein